MKNVLSRLPTQRASQVGNGSAPLEADAYRCLIIQCLARMCIKVCLPYAYSQPAD